MKKLNAFLNTLQWVVGFIFIMCGLSAHADTLIAGRAAIATYRNDYSGSSKTAGSYFTVVSSLLGSVNEIQVFDSSGQDLLMAYAPTCGGLGSSTDVVAIPPGGNGSILFAIPVGYCVGVQPVSGNATTGIILLTFLR